MEFGAMNWRIMGMDWARLVFHLPISVGVINFDMVWSGRHVLIYPNEGIERALIRQSIIKQA